MAYSLSNICTKITGIGQLLLTLSLVVEWYTFLRHNEVKICRKIENTLTRNLAKFQLKW